jgi:iron-sulfur cluster assembly protein
MTITVTPTAADEVRKFIEEQGAVEAVAGLRVAVLPGGCSGFQYGLNIEDEAQDDDDVLESNGIRLFVDPFSGQYLDGVEIDYVTTMMGSGFTFKNPNASGGCGCGSSFTA